MRGDVFDQSDFVEHYYLRYKCDCLEPQTEAPHEFPRGPARIHHTRDHQCGRQQYFQMWEVVTQGVVGRAERFFIAHQVDDEGSRRDEK